MFAPYYPPRQESVSPADFARFGSVADRYFREIDGLLGELRAIPHVELIRLGTRLPVTLPFRVTDALCALLEGAGVPKITIRAFNREIDWPQMVSNLLAISEGDSIRIGEKPDS